MKIAKKAFLGLAMASIIFIGLANFYLQPVNAQNFWDKQIGRDEIANAYGQNAGNPTDVRQVAVYTIKVFLTFIGIIVTAYIIVAGYKWMTAAGNDDKVQDAKKQITNAVIGLIIILLAYVIVQFVATCLFDIIHDGGTWMCRFPHG